MLGRGRLQITSVNATINTTFYRRGGWRDSAPFLGETDLQAPAASFKIQAVAGKHIVISSLINGQYRVE